MSTAETLYEGLTTAGLEVLLDDRVERPGVKFADSELIGIPYRVTVGPRGVEAGIVETLTRRDMEKDEIAIHDVGAWLVESVVPQRTGL